MSEPAQQDRLAKAREIANNPVAYKVCEGCDSIVTTEVGNLSQLPWIQI